MGLLSSADLNGMTKRQLQSLIERGIVQVMTTAPNTDLTAMAKDDLPEYQKNAHLKGIGISISAGARKYNLTQPSISRWVSSGIIARIGMDRNRILIDEADLAYCAEIYHQNPGAGKRIFNPDGTPYTPKKSE